MNADIVKRIVQAIADESQGDLDRLARKVVELERQRGHGKLADYLQAILNRPKKRKQTLPKPVIEDGSLHGLPLSRRHGESLAEIITRDSLEHHMVLPLGTEARFARIECEYAARERLATYGLRPRKTILLHGPECTGA